MISHLDSPTLTAVWEISEPPTWTEAPLLFPSPRLQFSLSPRSAKKSDFCNLLKGSSWSPMIRIRPIARQLVCQVFSRHVNYRFSSFSLCIVEFLGLRINSTGVFFEIRPPCAIGAFRLFLSRNALWGPFDASARNRCASIPSPYFSDISRTSRSDFFDLSSIRRRRRLKKESLHPFSCCSAA